MLLSWTNRIHSPGWFKIKTCLCSFINVNMPHQINLYRKHVKVWPGVTNSFEKNHQWVWKNIGTPSPSKYHSRVPLPSKNFLSTSSGSIGQHSGHASDGKKGVLRMMAAIKERSMLGVASEKDAACNCKVLHASYANRIVEKQDNTVPTWSSKICPGRGGVASNDAVSSLMMKLPIATTKNHETAMKQWWLSITSSEINHPSLNGYKPGLLHGATRDMSGTHGLQNATPQNKLACQCQLAPHQHVPSGSFPI